jgi:uncharacterized protein (DUF1330 family)
MRIAAATLIAATVVAAAACGSDGDDEGATVTPAGTATPDTRTPIERLTSVYADPVVDPSAQAWTDLLADPAFETQQVAVVEFVQLNDNDRAKTAYDSFVAAISAATSDAGGAIVSVNDILMPGLEGLERYEGGVTWVATYPSASAYVDSLLDPRVVAAAPDRAESIAEAQILMGPNLVPDVIKQLGPNTPASDFPSDRVQGKTTDQIIDELLAIYPSGGADPPEATLRRLIDAEGFHDQRLFYVNLYRFNDVEGGGEQALGEYNAAALPVVLAHGGRPKVLANVTHHLVGPTAWDRFIFVSWPSFAVFTDLRLDPTYIEAQKDRVASAEEYGNLVTVARDDQSPTPTP